MPSDSNEVSLYLSLFHLISLSLFSAKKGSKIDAPVNSET